MRIIENTKFKVATGAIKEQPWFIDPKYDESIKTVIGKALADCVTNKNEFKDKGAKGLITFEGSIINDYNPANWNAVMLYNYVNMVIKGRSGSTKEILADCISALYKYYDDNQARLGIKDISAVESGLRKAWDDILEYVDKLELSMENKVPGTGEIAISKLQKFYNAYKTGSNKVKLFDLLNENKFEVGRYDSKDRLWHRFVPIFAFQHNKFCISGIVEDTNNMTPSRQSKQYVFSTISRASHYELNDILETINKFDSHLLTGLNIEFYSNPDCLKRLYIKGMPLAYSNPDYLKGLHIKGMPPA